MMEVCTFYIRLKAGANPKLLGIFRKYKQDCLYYLTGFYLLFSVAKKVAKKLRLDKNYLKSKSLCPACSQRAGR